MIEEIYVKDTNHGNQELFDSENIILNEISVVIHRVSIRKLKIAATLYYL